MEPWMIERTRREQEVGQEMVPLYVPPAPSELEGPRHQDNWQRDEQPTRGYCVIEE